MFIEKKKSPVSFLSYGRPKKNKEWDFYEKVIFVTSKSLEAYMNDFLHDTCKNKAHAIVKIFQNFSEVWIIVFLAIGNRVKYMNLNGLLPTKRAILKKIYYLNLNGGTRFKNFHRNYRTLDLTLYKMRKNFLKQIIS